MADNDSLTCAASSVQATPAFPYPSALTTVVRVAFFIYYTILFFLGIILNTVIIVLVSKYKKLQTVPFFLALQIVIVDLCGAALLTPLSIISAGANRWLLSEYVCIITGILYYIIGFGRTELMLVLVTDRFLTIFAPFFYPKRQQKIIISLSVTAIVLPLVIAIIPAFLDCYSFSATIAQCQFSSDCSTMCNVLRNVIAFVFIVPSCVIPLFFYSALYWKAKKFRNQVIVLATYSDIDTPNKEWRTTLTFFLMFVTLFVVTVPPGSITLIGNLAYSPTTKPLWFSLVETVLYNIIPLILVLDPIVILRNADVREVWSEIQWPSICPWF